MAYGVSAPDPTDGQTNVPRSHGASFNMTYPGVGIDPEDVSVEISFDSKDPSVSDSSEDVVVLGTGAFEPAWDGSFTPIADGYYVEFAYAESDLPADCTITVTVSYVGQDDFSWTFETENSAIPSFSNLYPIDGSIGIFTTSSVSFDVVDTDGTINLDQLAVSIDVSGSLETVIGLGTGSFYPGFSGSLTPIADGYAVDFTRDTDYPYSSPITVTATYHNNITDPSASWSFTTQPDYPIWQDESPSDGAIDVSVDAEVTIDFVDPIDPVYESQVLIEVYVGDEYHLVYDDDGIGYIGEGWTGDYEQSEGADEGHGSHFFFTRDGGFPYDTVVHVFCTYDIGGPDERLFDWSFTTESGPGPTPPPTPRPIAYRKVYSLLRQQAKIVEGREGQRFARRKIIRLDPG